MTQADITELDVLGYTIAGAVVPLTITGTEANQALIDQSTIAPFSGVTISDQNTNQTETATVTLSSAANGALTNLGGGSYNASTGVYTVSGSLAAVNAALDGLVFIPTFDQIQAGQTVITNFALRVADGAGAVATDTATSVVAVSSGSSGGSGNLKSVSLASGSSFTDTGTVYFGGAPVTWTGKASVADNPSSLSWTAYSGTMAQEILAAQSPVASDVPSTQFTTPALTALGLPFNAAGLAVWGDPTASHGAVSASDSIRYTFSAPAPAGTPFLLWAPGAGANGDTGPFAFNFSASLNGATVSTAGWTFSVVNPFGATPAASYSTNAATGQVAIRNFNESLFPDAVIVATPNTEVDTLQVAASTIPFDFWGLAFPTAPVTTTAVVVGPCTVTGVGGATLSLPIDTQANFALLQPLLDSIGNGVIAGTILPALPASPPVIPGGKSGLLQIDSAGLVAIPAGYATAIDDATSSVTIVGGTGNGQLVAAGKGGVDFSAGIGAGSVFAGGGNNLVNVGNGDGSQFIALGNGNDTVAAIGGNDTISGGDGSNLLFLGPGSDSVATAGADTVVSGIGIAQVTAAGAGSLVFGNFATTASVLDAIMSGARATISAALSVVSVTTSGANALVYGSFGAAAGSLNETDTGQNTTVYAGTFGASATLAGSDALLYGNFNNTPGILSVVDRGSGDTISAANSAMNGTLSGSQALMFGCYGSIVGAMNVIDTGRSDTIATGYSNATISGGSGGSGLLVFGGTGTLDFVGGTGAATVVAGSGAASITSGSGGGELVGGSGADSIVGGSGDDTVFAGSSTETLGGGGGHDIYSFVSSLTHGSADVILHFNANDTVYLTGYGANDAAIALSNAASAGGNTTITLADHTQVTFLNVPSTAALQGHLFSF